MNKKISVIIPVYNTNPEFLQKAINSVLNQTYKNIEVIIVNDGSTDNNTLNFLKTLDNKNINIINQENKGLGGARNTGINSATGDYIGFLDADDWLDKNFSNIVKHNNDHQCHQCHDADKVHHSFFIRINPFSSYCFNDQEYQTPSIQCRKRK